MTSVTDRALGIACTIMLLTGGGAGSGSTFVGVSDGSVSRLGAKSPSASNQPSS
jgi:hypothetical protein